MFRPKTFEQFIGNQDIKERLQMYIHVCKQEKRALPHLALFGPAGCQPKGQNVLMATGEWKDVSLVREGDIVLSPQENGNVIETNVISTKSYISEIYTVRVGARQAITPIKKKINYGEYRVAKEHIIVYKCGCCGKYSTMQAGEFKNIHCREKLGVFSPAIPFLTKDYVLSPYHLGILLGDGGLKKSVNITTKDKEIIEEIKKLAIQFNLKINTYKLCYHLCGLKKEAKGNSLINEVRKLGLFNTGCATKFIPQKYLTGDINQRLELLAGLIDTDGYKLGHKLKCDDISTYQLTTKSTQLANNIYSLCKSLGFGVNMRQKSKSCLYKGERRYGLYWYISISTQDLIIPLRVHRKKHKLRDTTWKNIRTKSMTIQPELKSEMVYGFTLNSPSGWYITNDWIITHNTGKSTLAGIITEEYGGKHLNITGASLRTQEELYVVLDKIRGWQAKKSPAFLFVDEIHVLPKSTLPEAVWLPLLEDFKFIHNGTIGQDEEIKAGAIDIVGKFYDNYGFYPSVPSRQELNRMKIEMVLKPFTVIGATTNPEDLSKPLRDRFSIHCEMKEYSVQEIMLIIRQMLATMSFKIEDKALLELAVRCRFNPRIANSFAELCVFRAKSKKEKGLTRKTVREEMASQHIDTLGLSDRDREILRILAQADKPIGASRIANIMLIKTKALTEMHESYMARIGLIDIGVKGRFLTAKGLEHLNTFHY